MEGILTDVSDPNIALENITKEDDMSNRPVAKGTKTSHFVKFINELLDIMDMDESMKGHYLVPDNASTHKSKPMVRKIESRGYREEKSVQREDVQPASEYGGGQQCG
ncbi:hypothetical protein EDC96DRAFT_601302 [Choanephora cucurbitarum]|nr:hypothetical protein EDC96DRAFT_601302 [Choanephora cucurbitarum]